MIGHRRGGGQRGGAPGRVLLFCRRGFNPDAFAGKASGLKPLPQGHHCKSERNLRSASLQLIGMAEEWHVAAAGCADGFSCGRDFSPDAFTA
ncbi:hypothetical protein HEP75_00438 [Xanthomonas sp. SI]|nr:hypothetical protein HEP75_00438 [Xanthomonas sp. SI]